jgi:putative phosphoribosyl transferase
MHYERRLDAGRILAEELSRLDLGPDVVVAGILRGGVVVAGPIAERLGAPLTAVHTRKLFSPLQPEFAFGAMDEDGHAILDYRAIVTLGLGESEVEAIKARIAGEIAQPAASCPGPSLAASLPGRTVVLVDDGLATGLTMQAAIAYARRHGATAIVVAVACASDRAFFEVSSLLSRAGDHVICPVVDADFRAVGDYFADFHPIAEEEVKRVPERAASAQPAVDKGSESRPNSACVN